MKAISLWQPWATLVAVGAKCCETRSWGTSYRGPIVIHAAKRWSLELRDLCLTEPFLGALAMHRPNQAGAFYLEDCLDEVCPRGVIVATAHLDACVSIDLRTTPVDRREQAFGDYSPGRFRWDLTDVRRFAEPIPYRGRQGLFEIPDAVLAPTPAREGSE